MKNSFKVMVAALTLVSSAWIATAQPTDNSPGDQGPPPSGGGGPPQGGPGRGHHRPPPAVVVVLDANHDGVIDADEIANASTALKTLDKNGDGQLSMDELLAPPPRPGGTNAAPMADRPPGPPPGAGFNGTNRPPVLPIIAALDANHDGVIDADEIANAPAALKTLDKNGDGQLTPDEFMPPRRGGPGGHHGHGPGGPGGQDGPPPDDQQGGPPPLSGQQ